MLNECSQNMLRCISAWAHSSINTVKVFQNFEIHSMQELSSTALRTKTVKKGPAKIVEIVHMALNMNHVYFPS